jgi:hypothetical protein
MKAVNVTDNQLDVFEAPMIDSAIEDQQYVVYYDDDGETFTQQKTNNYVIRTKDLNSFLNIRDSFLELSIAGGLTLPAVAARAGQATAAAAEGQQYIVNVGAQNGVTVKAANDALAVRKDYDGSRINAVIIKNAWCWFTNVRYTINEVTIEDISEPQECSDMKLYKNLNPDSAKAYNKMNFYNGPTHPNALTPSNYTEVNTGTIQRSFLPLSSLLGVDDAKLMRGLKHTLHLTPERDYSKIVQVLSEAPATGAAGAALGAPTDIGLYIQRLRWWVPVAEPSLKSILDYDREVDSGASTIHLFCGMRHYYSENSTAQQRNYYVNSEDNHIKRVYVWVMPVDKETSYVDRNFERGIETLTSVELRLNSEILPRERLNFVLTAADADASRPYNMMLDSMDKSLWNPDNEPVLTFEDWRSSQNIFVFEAPQRYDHLDAKSQDVNVKVNFSAVPDQYRIHVVIETENQLMVSGSDNRVSLGLTRERLESE